MKLELMNEEEQVIALMLLEQEFGGDEVRNLVIEAGGDPDWWGDSAIYRCLRSYADKQGFCCVSYMLEAE